MIETISLVDAVKDANVQQAIGITSCVKTRNSVDPADLDSVKQNGIYNVIESPSVVISNGLLIVHTYSTFTIQEFYNYNLNIMKIRIYWNTLGWSNWKSM